MEPIEILLPETDSTNNRLREMINSGEMPEFSSVRADYQTAGRGQVGNTWESERGKNLLMSFLVRPEKLDVHLQFYLSMAISIAIVETVAQYVDNVRIKWPNDIYVADKKLVGILIENNLRGAQIAETIVGLGLNVNQLQFLSDAPNPVSLAQLTGKNYNIDDIARDILFNAKRWISEVKAEKWDAITDRYMALLYRNDGRYHAFRDAQGEFRGRIVSIAPDGRLHLIDTDGECRQYYFKEVEYIINE